MRKGEIKEFARKLHELEKHYGVVIHSDNYHTRALINDIPDGFSYYYKEGEIELDINTYTENEDIE